MAKDPGKKCKANTKTEIGKKSVLPTLGPGGKGGGTTGTVKAKDLDIISISTNRPTKTERYGAIQGEKQD